MDNLPPHRHSVYGLTVATWIPFPELPPAPADAPVDAVFRLGKVPTELAGAHVRRSHFQAAPGQLLTGVIAAARFHVREGREVIVQPEPGTTERDLRSLALCSPMGALLHQRGVLPLHASAVVTERGAIAFCGRSGHGKSTLAGLFHRRGHPILADDIAAVTFDHAGRPEVAPGYPQFKMRRDSLAALGHGATGLPQVRSPHEKFGFALPQGFHTRSEPLVRLYVIEVTESARRLELETLPGAEQLRHLIAHTYRKGYLAGLGRQPAHFQSLARLIATVRVKRIKRPAGRGFELEELAGLLTADMAT